VDLLRRYTHACPALTPDEQRDLDTLARSRFASSNEPRSSRPLPGERSPPPSLKPRVVRGLPSTPGFAGSTNRDSNEQKAIPIKRSRIDEILEAEGLSGGTRRPGSASGLTPRSPQKGTIEKLYTTLTRGSVIVCLDEIGSAGGQELPLGKCIQPIRVELVGQTTPAG
jgi:hypothetical protein